MSLNIAFLYLSIGIYLTSFASSKDDKRDVQSIILGPPSKTSGITIKSYKFNAIDNEAPPGKDYRNLNTMKEYEDEFENRKNPEREMELLSDNYDDSFEAKDSSLAKREGKVKKAKKETDKGPKVWDHWGKWSDCTVTCGFGKMTRWRHCVSGGCASGEKEAQIKTCTNPAC